MRRATTLLGLLLCASCSGGLRRPEDPPAWAGGACPFGRPPGGAVGGAGRTGSALAWDETTQTGLVADADNDAVVFFRTGPAPAVLRRVRTLAGPAQAMLVAGSRLLVAERLANAVSLYDVCSGARIATTAVARDPVALALSPDGRAAYVLSSLGRAVTELDAATLAARRAVELEGAPRGLAVDPRGRRLFVTHLAGAPLSVIELGGAPDAPLSARRVGFELGDVEVSDEYRGYSAGGGYYGSGGPGRFYRRSVFRGTIAQRTSQAWSAAVDADGRVAVPLALNRPDQSLGTALGSGGRYGGPAQIEPTGFALLVWSPQGERWSLAYPTEVHDHATGADVRVPTAAAVDPRGGALVIASTGNGRVARVRAGASGNAAIETRRTLEAPSALAVKPSGELLVFSQVEHAVEFGPTLARRRLTVGPDPLPADVSLGRRLFYTADDPRLSASGLACAGCHPDGRDDGLVWWIDDAHRQTPTLRGRTMAPYNWRGESPTLAASVAQSVRRIGGTGPGERALAALAAYVERGMPVPPEPARALGAREQRGRELFSGAAACDGCHDPARGYADGGQWVVLGTRFDTPSLRFVGATAPYFHDGRYPTLEALLVDPLHGMGRAHALAEGDRADLAAYLRTL